MECVQMLLTILRPGVHLDKLEETVINHTQYS